MARPPAIANADAVVVSSVGAIGLSLADARTRTRLRRSRNRPFVLYSRRLCPRPARCSSPQTTTSAPAQFPRRSPGGRDAGPIGENHGTATRMSKANAVVVLVDFGGGGSRDFTGGGDGAGL